MLGWNLLRPRKNPKKNALVGVLDGIIEKKTTNAVSVGVLITIWTTVRKNVLVVELTSEIMQPNMFVISPQKNVLVVAANTKKQDTTVGFVAQKVMIMIYIIVQENVLAMVIHITV